MVNKDFDNPYTFENSSNPWLMGSKDELKAYCLDNAFFTAEYLWELDKEQRKEALMKVFEYLRHVRGFPAEEMTEEEIVKEFIKLRKADASKVFVGDSFVSNNGNICLDVCRYINNDCFWKSRGDDSTMSIEDVFNDDDLLMQVLMNRMGWNTSIEDGTERPYMFTINDSSIRAGIRNSGLGYGVSNFRPLIAKALMEKYLSKMSLQSAKPVILDYSAGWGARALAALSIDAAYFGIDPLTADNVLKLNDILAGHHSGYCDVFKGCSENPAMYDHIPDNVDLCLSCPPYFTLERYSNEETQSYNKFEEFDSWIEEYWRPTVENCCDKLKERGVFVLIIKDYYKKYPLMEAMKKVCEENNLELFEDLQYITNKNHLSKKKGTGISTKSTEHVLAFRKKTTIRDYCYAYVYKQQSKDENKDIKKKSPLIAKPLIPAYSCNSNQQII